MICIGIAEDQALVRESLAIVLDLQQDMHVLWTAEHGADAISAMDRDPVDVVLMDLRLPGVDGVAAIKSIKSRHGDATLIVLTTFNHEEWLIDAVHAGAAACFLKEIPPKLLIDAIRSIVRSSWNPEQWSTEWRTYAPEIQFQVRKSTVDANNGTASTLTGREVDILRALCQGYSNEKIAAYFHLTKGTVKNYVSSIYSKLEVTHRVEAVTVARQKGLC